MKNLKLFAAVVSLAAGACATDDNNQPPVTTPTAFKLKIDNIAPWRVLKSGTQAQKTTGASGPLSPGEAYELQFTAGKKQAVSFAAMLGESNDWFFGPGPDGIALYDADGKPVSGDVTSQVSLWNAGTEIDQEPAVGDSTGPKQSAPDFGAPDPDPNVREIPVVSQLSDGSSFTRPAISQMIKVTLTPGANQSFTLRIENVSTATTLVTSAGSRIIHVSPFAWAVHNSAAPIFEVGKPDRGEGLELIAESGRVASLGGVLHVLSGAATPISPGVVAVHADSEPFYSLGLADRGQGIEQLAESGNNMPLLDVMTGVAAAGGLNWAGSFDIPVGATAKGAAKPGSSFELTISGMPGDSVSFATMFGMSDDWFFATSPEGIALFDAEGQPVKGDVSDQIAIYDTGSEVDEELAIGPDTGPQQPAPDTGAADPIKQVREVPQSAYGLPASAHLRVTLTPQ
jgi:hypothetical protein